MAHQGHVSLQVRGPGAVRLFGGLVTGDDGSERQGPSFGEWPHASVYRLMHDGEYRLAARHALSSVSRDSFVRGCPTVLARSAWPLRFWAMAAC